MPFTRGFPMPTCWSLLCKYGNFKPFYPHDVAIPGAKILLNFLDFLYFCHILLDAYNCIFWQLFPSFLYFCIIFHLYHDLVSQYVISIGIFSNDFFIFTYLSNFSHIFFPYFVVFFHLYHRTTPQKVLSFITIKKLNKH